MVLTHAETLSILFLSHLSPLILEPVMGLACDSCHCGACPLGLILLSFLMYLLIKRNYSSIRKNDLFSPIYFYYGLREVLFLRSF